MNPIRYDAIYSRAYPIPTEFARIHTDAYDALTATTSDAAPIERLVFDGRYLDRHRVSLVELPDWKGCSVVTLEGQWPLRLSCRVICHVSGHLVVMVGMHADAVPHLESIAKAIQDRWIDKPPANQVVALPDGRALSMRDLCNAAYVGFIAKTSIGFEKKARLDFDAQVDMALGFNNVESRPPLFESLFPWVNDRSAVRPTIFGCTSIFTVARVEGPEAFAASEMIRTLAGAPEQSGWRLTDIDEVVDQNLLLCRRNAAVVATVDGRAFIDAYMPQIAFLNLVRHFSNVLGTLGSERLDACQTGRILKDTLEQVAGLQRFATALHDELHDLNLWHRPEHVRRSHKLRHQLDWNLRYEIDQNMAKLDRLSTLTAELMKVQNRNMHRLVSGVVAAIGFLSLLELIPLLSEPLLGHPIAWAIIGIALVVVFVLAYRWGDGEG